MSDKKMKASGAGKSTAANIRNGVGKPLAIESVDYTMPRLSEREIDDALAARGETRASVMQGFRSLEARVRASHMLQSIAHRASIAAPPHAPIEPALSDLRIFDDCVSAGVPTWEGSDAGRPITLADLFGRQNWGQVFFTRVAGSSMIGDHIQDGDVLLVDPSQEAKNGNVIVAHVAGHGQVCKRLRIEGGNVFLDSSNPDYSPIRIEDPSTLTIHGVVKGFVAPVDPSRGRNTAFR